jgi:hypothetical protein
MRKWSGLFMLATVGWLFSLNVFAQGNETPNGAHYNLNIIGVENAKKADMTGSNRHTIFVPLVTEGKGKRSTNNQVEVHTQIWLAPGDTFRVCDGNGFDLAYGCADNPFWDDFWNVDVAECEVAPGVWEECAIFTRKEGAVFELPCNNNITNDQDGFIECGGGLPQASYEVWARALGSPKNDPFATITTCGTVTGVNEEDVSELQCSTENTVQTRTKGRSPFEDVTDALTSMVIDICIEFDAITGDCIEYETTRIALFSGDTEDWFWNYVNNGLRLLQLRFYDAN